MGFLKQRYAIGIFILVAIFMALPVFNVEAGENDNFLITVETDKEVYEVGETVEYLIKVKNISQNEAKDVSIIDELPSNIRVINTDGQINGNKISWEKDELLPEEEVALHLSIMLNEVSVTPPVDGSDSNDDTIPPTEGGDGTYDDTVPPTAESTGDGDTPSKDDNNQLPSDISGSKPDTGYNNFIMLMMGIILLGLGYLLYKVKGKKIGKFFIFILLCSMTPNTDVNAENISVSQEYSHSVKINGESIESKITINANMMRDENVQPELVNLSLTLFEDEYQTLSNDVVDVKVGEETAYSFETSEKGFLKLQVPVNSSVSINHPSIESMMTIDDNGDVSVVNKKGEVVIGFIERSEAGFVSYRENITNLKADSISKIELLNLESGQFIYDGILELERNEILVIPAFGDYVSGIAIKIVESKIENSKTVATIIQPELKEVYESIDIEIQPSMENAQIKLEDGVELADDITYAQHGFSADIKKFNVGDIEVSGEVSASIENDLRINIDFDWFETDIKEIRYEIDAATALEFSTVYKDISGELAFERKLFTISIPTPVFGISVDIPIVFECSTEGALEATISLENISGELAFERKLFTISIPTPVFGISVDIPIVFECSTEGALEATISLENEFNFGIQYTSRTGLKTFPESSEIFSEDLDITPVRISLEGKAGLNLAPALAALRMDILGMGVGAGLKVNGTSEADADFNDGVNLCVSYDAGVYGTIGLESDLIPFLEGFEYEHYTPKLEGTIGLCSQKPNVEVLPKNIVMIPGESVHLLIPFLEGFEYEHYTPKLEGTIGLCSQKPNVEVLPKNIVMIPGESVHLMLMSGREEITFSPDVTYKSEDPSKLSVDSDGVVTATASGVGQTVNIIATYKKDGLETKVEVPILIQDPSMKGTLKGQIVDANSENPIDRAKITLYDESGGYINRYYTDSSGNYRLLLQPGTYLVSIEKAGYLKEAGKVKVTVANTTVYEPKLHLISESEDGEGTIRGQITHAINNNPLSQVQLEIYKGFNNDSGELVTTIQTNEMGEYETILPAGNYTAVVKKDGFISSTMGILAIGSQVRVQPTLSLSPEGLALDDIRIVLNWGVSPADLDSHLIGTTDNTMNDYFHVYYGNKNYSGNEQSAFLDRDDTSSYGPETITLTNLDSEGHYVYSIHDFTNKGNTQNNALRLSEATVKVYAGTNLLATFAVPQSEVGNVWKVFEIVNGQIVPLNEVTTISDYHSYQSFLPNRISSLFSIESLNEDMLINDEKHEIQSEVANPEIDSPESEVVKPEIGSSESEEVNKEVDSSEPEVEEPETASDELVGSVSGENSQDSVYRLIEVDTKSLKISIEDEE